MNEVMKRKSGDIFPFKLVQVRGSDKEIKLNQSAVLIFDKCAAYRNFHQRALLKNFYPKDFRFLVYIKNFDEDRKKCFAAADPFNMFRHETSIESGDEDSLKLVTFVTFQQPDCRNWKKLEVNQFSKSSRKWQSRKFFLEKFKNFNGCEVEFQISRYRQTSFD